MNTTVTAINATLSTIDPRRMSESAPVRAKGPKFFLLLNAKLQKLTLLVDQLRRGPAGGSPTNRHEQVVSAGRVGGLVDRQQTLIGGALRKPLILEESA